MLLRDVPEAREAVSPRRRRQGLRPDPFSFTKAANVHYLTPAAELLHGDEEVVYGDAGYQGITKGPEMAGHSVGFAWRCD